MLAKSERQSPCGPSGSPPVNTLGLHRRGRAVRGRNRQPINDRAEQDRDETQHHTASREPGSLPGRDAKPTDSHDRLNAERGQRRIQHVRDGQLSATPGRAACRQRSAAGQHRPRRFMGMLRSIAIAQEDAAGSFQK
jgi:hypothetical protein